MIQIIKIVILISLPRLIQGQVFDTIPNFDGTFMVIEERENERIKKLAEQNGYTLLKGNFVLIDSIGKIVSERIYKELGENQSIETHIEGGIKIFEEIYLKNSTAIKQWYPSGNIRFEENSYFYKKFGFKERREYYDNGLNSLKNIYVEKAIEPDTFKGIIIEKWRTYESEKITSHAVEIETNRKIFIPYHEVNFYPNGVIKEEGKFIKRKFWEFRSKEFYEEWLKGEKGRINKKGRIDGEMVVLHLTVKVKDGRWKYFDRQGNLIRMETYKDGRLKKE